MGKFVVYNRNAPSILPSFSPMATKLSLVLDHLFKDACGGLLPQCDPAVHVICM